MAKSKIIFRSLLFLFCIVCSSFQNPSITNLRSVYLSQVGQMEHPLGSNWGYPVKKYLASVHDYQPDPWCAAFVHFCLDSAGYKTNITAAASSGDNLKHRVYFKTKLYEPIQYGDVFTIFFPSMGRIGHTGFVDQKVNDGIYSTVEGNTNNNGSREGIGVFKRKRSLHTLYSVSRWTN